MRELKCALKFYNEMTKWPNGKKRRNDEMTKRIKSLYMYQI